ncbi:MAG: nicotinate-nucleotide adenylyltransferase [Flavobacteriales bacterium]|jgi:nicotinate-nucleotide adenylyltransferase
MKEVGLYFGTFNPIHSGHLMLATYMVNATAMDSLWFVVTPQNPDKKNQNLLEDHHRLEMVHRALEGFDKLKVTDIEFGLKKPNYTVDTLVRLREKYPETKFSLIIGEDNLYGFHKWKNHDEILKYHTLYVYPRHTDVLLKETSVPHVLVKAPRIELSSSFIRNTIKENLECRPFLPGAVFQYIDEMNFYR